MNNPHAIGLPALILGIVTTTSSVNDLLGASVAWTTVSSLGNLAGTVGGFALTLIGLAILQGWGEFAIAQTGERDG